MGERASEGFNRLTGVEVEMVQRMPGEDGDGAVEQIMDAVNVAPQDNEAVLEITYQGQQGTLTDPVPWDAADGDLKQWATEALQAGGIPGLDATPNADFTDFVVHKFDAKDGLPNRIVIRPKTEYGS
jgi:hypothetical protein